MRLFRWIDRALDIAYEALFRLAAVMLFLMFAFMNAEVAARYLFGSALYFADEYSRYLFTYLTLIGFAYCYRKSYFLNVNMALHRLPPRVVAFANMSSALVGLLLMAVVIDASWHTFWLSFRFNTLSTEPSQTPLYIPQSALPFGFGLLALAFLQTAIRNGFKVFGATADEETER